MNKLDLSFNGGMPFESDDLSFEQDSSREMFAGIAKMFLEDDQTVDNINYILSGLRPTDVGGTSTKFEEGFVSINGELFFVPGITLINLIAGESYVAQILETNLVAGDEVFEDGSSKSTYKQRQAPIKIIATGSVDDVIDIRLIVSLSINKVTPRWYDLITEKLTFRDGVRSQSIDNAVIKGFADVTNKLSGLTAVNMELFVDIAGNVHLNAFLAYTGTPANNDILFRMPVGFTSKTNNKRGFTAHLDDASTNRDLIGLEVQTDGDVVVKIPTSYSLTTGVGPELHISIVFTTA